MFFGDRNRNDNCRNSRREGRALRFEPLEDRQLLSADGFRPSPPCSSSNEFCAVAETRDLSASRDDIVVVSLASDESADNALDSAALAEVDAVWKSLGSVDDNASVAKLARDEAPDAAIAVLNLADADTDGGDSSDNADNGGYRSGEGSGGISSGDHTIHTNVFASGGVGRNVVVGGRYMVKEGSSVRIELEDGSYGDVVHYDIICGTANMNDFGANSLSGDVVINPAGDNSVNLYVLFDSILENDETFSISLSMASGISTLDYTTFNFTIVAQTDFISDPDCFENVPGPADSYLAYVKKNWTTGHAITQREAVSLEVNNANFRYAILSNDRDYFNINATTGVITLKRDVEDYYESLPSLNMTNDYYRFQISIGVYDSRMLDLSGGIVYYLDQATVTIDISHWYVSRNSDYDKAYAFANAGCTLAELGETVGLTVSEYSDWLTAAHNQVELFSGGFTYADQLTTSDVIVGTTSLSIQVPNTIFAAYCYNPYLISFGGEHCFQWGSNINQLRALGFHVETFYNNQYGFTSGASQAKADFVDALSDLSSDKSLHGIFLIGHGVSLDGHPDDSSFGYTGPCEHFDTDPDNEEWLECWDEDWGPQWTIDYIGDGFGAGNAVGDEEYWSIASALEYHLGTAIIYACDSYDYVSELVSSDGDFLYYGGIGTVYPENIAVGTLWTPTGYQGTKTVSIS